MPASAADASSMSAVCRPPCYVSAIMERPLPVQTIALATLIFLVGVAAVRAPRAVAAPAEETERVWSLGLGTGLDLSGNYSNVRWPVFPVGFHGRASYQFGRWTGVDLQLGLYGPGPIFGFAFDGDYSKDGEPQHFRRAIASHAWRWTVRSKSGRPIVYFGTGLSMGAYHYRFSWVYNGHDIVEEGEYVGVGWLCRLGGRLVQRSEFFVDLDLGVYSPGSGNEISDPAIQLSLTGGRVLPAAR